MISRLTRLVVHSLALTAIAVGLIACSQRYALARAPESLAPPRLDPAPSFAPIEIPIATWNLFDLGVVDVNDDGLLDVFTSNHNARQSLLINYGGLRFSDKLSELGLDQDATFPGLEDSDVTPQMDSPGLYVYFHERKLILRAFNLPVDQPVQGELRFMSSLEVLGDAAFQTTKKLLRIGENAMGARVQFSVRSDGVLKLSPYLLAVPITLVMAQETDPSLLRIGQNRVAPTTRSITLALRDRHGMAWADRLGDSHPEVFIVRGGLKGRMRQLPSAFFDEAFVWSDGVYSDRCKELGFTKGGHRSRKAAWVDANGDGRLDVHVQCIRTPDQLFVCGSDGRFADVARDLGLGAIDSGAFIWFDVDSDADMDLLCVREKALVLYRYADGAFSRSLLDHSIPGNLANFTIGDFDGDGDLDVFAASRRGSRVLLNVNGELSSKSAESFGLPKSVAAASWVDFDNDGLEDLFAVPGGLYRQFAPGRFEATGLLVLDRAVFEARCTWVDLDNDGLRDVILATKPNKKTLKWHVQAYRNMASRNNWLQVKLIGSRGNRPAIGAVVSVSCGARETLQMVGHAEGSHYSQGHYRLYFGLELGQSVERVRVTWPSGATQELRDVDANTLLTIKQE